MNHLSNCLFGIFALVCFASCSKDPDATPAPIDDPAQNDTTVLPRADTFLSKAIIWDSADLGATAYTWEYVFDDQKRVKMRIVYNSDTNGVKLLAAKTDTSMQFFYNGAERNAYRTIGWSFFASYDNADVLHYYNGNNQIIKDSIYASPTSFMRRTYIYLSDKLITYDTSVISGLPPQHSRDSFQIINNNISHARFTYAPGIGYDDFDLTYDNKINPLTKLNIAPDILLEGGRAFDKNPYLTSAFCKNNMTKRVGKYRQNPQTTETDIFQYTYNESNLPVYCKISYSVYTKSSGRVKYKYIR